MATTLMTFVRRNVGPGLAAGALAGILVACGGGNDNDSTSSAPEQSGESGTSQVDVKMTDFKMQLSRTTLEAGDYTFVAKNDGDHDHALEIEGSGTEEDAHAGTRRVGEPHDHAEGRHVRGLLSRRRAQGHGHEDRAHRRWHRFTGRRHQHDRRQWLLSARSRSSRYGWPRRERARPWARSTSTPQLLR